MSAKLPSLQSKIRAGWAGRVSVKIGAQQHRRHLPGLRGLPDETHRRQHQKQEDPEERKHHHEYQNPTCLLPEVEPLHQLTL